jgi:hypothetical protein
MTIFELFFEIASVLLAIAEGFLGLQVVFFEIF